LAVKQDIIQKSGTWFSYGEERLGQGRENVKKYLLDNPDLMNQIDRQVREALGLLKPQKDQKDEKEEQTV
ncbi:MAG: DNA recombination/repair protein RecA, partial [Calditrichaeota bacterium]